MVPAVVVWLVCTRRHYKCSSWHQCEGSISGFEWPWCAYILTQACSTVLTPPPRNGVTVLHSSGGTAIHQVPPPLEVPHVGALKPEVVAQSHATHVSFSWHVLPMLATERHHLNDSYAFLQNALAPAKAYLEWPYHIYMTYCSSVFSVVPALSFTDVVERSVLSSVRCKAVRS